MVLQTRIFFLFGDPEKRCKPTFFSVCRTTFLSPSKSLLRVQIKRLKDVSQQQTTTTKIKTEKFGILLHLFFSDRLLMHRNKQLHMSQLFFFALLMILSMGLSRKYHFRRPYIAPGGCILYNEKELGETLLL